MKISAPINETIALTLSKGESESILVLPPSGAERSECTFRAELDEGASLQMVFVCHSLESTRHNIRIDLRGKGAQCELSGLYLTAAGEETLFNVEMIHSAPECISSQLFKGIVSGNGYADFFGLIRVPQDSQKTEAYQENHNLLLDEQSRAHTRPQLEIYADDVKCSHGATIGRLDPDGLFYLRSRGISLAEAQKMQQRAFLSDVIEKIEDEKIREQISELI